MEGGAALREEHLASFENMVFATGVVVVAFFFWFIVDFIFSLVNFTHGITKSAAGRACRGALEEHTYGTLRTCLISERPSNTGCLHKIKNN